jgi:proline utilization trans-activator
MATRPLLLSVLIELLDKLNQGREAWRSLLHVTRTLISAGIKSASKTIQILSDEDSISAFLIFDLEFLYGAAIHLLMANAVFPDIAQAQSFYDCSTVHAIFDEHKSKGNRLAQVRKEQLAHLELSFHELAAKVEQQGLETPSLAGPPRALRAEPMILSTIEQRQSTEPDQESATRRNSPFSVQGPVGDAFIHVPTPGGIATAATGTLISSGSIDPPGPGSIQSSNTEFLETIGISSDEFFRIVDQMAYSDATTIGVFDP